MSRAKMKQNERELQETIKNAKALPMGGGQRIKLQNPVADYYDAWICGNAKFAEQVVENGVKEGKTVAICGAGPSLADNLDRLDEADEVWGCNSALTWLYDEGHRVTHGFTIDQTPAMVGEWLNAPPVEEYLVASTIHPNLTELLLKKKLSLRWFHNFVGIKKPPVEYCACGHDQEYHADHGKGGCQRCDIMPCREYRPRRMFYEDWLYTTLYPITCRAGSGLNSVSRAIDVAVYQGFEKVLVLGADCALRIKREVPEGVEAGSKAHREWLMESQMHVNGGHAMASGATGVTLGGKIDGRHWESKPDLLITAVFLEKMRQKLPERIELIGDTLPNALRGKSDEFLRQLPTLTDGDGNPIIPGSDGFGHLELPRRPG